MHELLSEESQCIKKNEEDPGKSSTTMRTQSRLTIRHRALDNSSADDFDEGRRAEVVMMLVDEKLRDRLESHCFVEKPMHDDERVECLFKVIHSM